MVHKERGSSGFEEGFQVTPPMSYMKDEHVFSFDHVDH
jgi:hypothetical protein